MNSFSKQVLDFHKTLKPNWELPKGFDLLFPYSEVETCETMTKFYDKYYDDAQTRTFLFGINPGRFGAGVTGVPFTDPVRLQNVCEIENPFHKRQELSSVFIYEIVAAFGGPNAFHKDYYITSVCPLGFTKGGNNINYYDDKTLEKAVEKYIIQNLNDQTQFPCNRKTALCLGQGKNFKYFNKLNEKHGWFEKIVPLPHPRWVMQYRRKRMEEFRDLYVNEMTKAKL